jgi:SpoVK/Ycf46/Vps4 family AAA+-type ATPase
MADRTELERRLLANPFDAEARGQYARLLLEAGLATEALGQFELLAQQTPERAEGPLGAARALLALGRRDEALARYARCGSLEGFSADEALERLEPQAQPTGPAHLRVVPGRPEKVVALPAPSADTVRFSDIVGVEELKQTIRLKIIEPFRNPGLFQRFRKGAGGGILLYGPPGCGKTMLARAVANECHAEFVSVAIADVLNMWIGESERNLAAIFEKARAKAPCVLFFDEVDALAYARSKAQSEHTRRIVNEFLAQLDGMGRDNRNVLILGATNMPWDVDQAMRRPGRFDRQVFVPPPDAEARRAMLRLKLHGVPQDGLNLDALAKATASYSGADIDGLIDLAKEKALHEALTGKPERPLRQADFVAALDEMVPSTLDWLRTARNLVKYAGNDRSYAEVEAYLKRAKLL